VLQGRLGEEPPPGHAPGLLDADACSRGLGPDVGPRGLALRFDPPGLRFRFLQALMEALNVAVAFRVAVGRATMGDPQPRRRFQEAARGELRAVVPLASLLFAFLGVTAGQALP
jgi:hypothetical protein